MHQTLDVTKKHKLAFNRGKADAIWERTAEQAVLTFRRRGVGAARPLWIKAIDIADSQFTWGDPRLAASYANQAFCLIQSKEMHRGQLLSQAAMRCWKDSWRWVYLMTPPSISQQFDAPQYTDNARQSFYELIEHGQTVTDMLAQGRTPLGGFEDWLRHKPKTMCDLRKLVGSVFLLASKTA